MDMVNSASFCLVFFIIPRISIYSNYLFKTINVTFMFRIFFPVTCRFSIFLHLFHFSSILFCNSLEERNPLTVFSSGSFLSSFEFQCHREHFFIFILWPILINYWFVCSTSQYIIATFTNANRLLSILTFASLLNFLIIWLTLSYFMFASSSLIIAFILSII